LKQTRLEEKVKVRPKEGSVSQGFTKDSMESIASSVKSNENHYEGSF